MTFIPFLSLKTAILVFTVVKLCTLSVLIGDLPIFNFRFYHRPLTGINRRLTGFPSADFQFIVSCLPELTGDFHV